MQESVLLRVRDLESRLEDAVQALRSRKDVDDVKIEAQGIRWMIEDHGGWFLGPGRDGVEGSVGHWYADTPLAWSFANEGDAIAKFTEHKLTCEVGIVVNGRANTCLCDRAEVVSRLWPSGVKVEVCRCCDKIVPSQATSFALSGENDGPWFFMCMNCQRKCHYECLGDEGGRSNPMGWCKVCRAERNLVKR